MTLENYKRAGAILEEIEKLEHEQERLEIRLALPHSVDDDLIKMCIEDLEDKKKKLQSKFEQL